jgi:hypothetical protein
MEVVVLSQAKPSLQTEQRATLKQWHGHWRRHSRHLPCNVVGFRLVRH